MPTSNNRHYHCQSSKLSRASDKCSLLLRPDYHKQICKLHMYMQSSQFGVFQRVRFLVEWGLGGSGCRFPRKLLNLAILKSLEMHQFLKRWTFKPSLKALRKAVSKIKLRNSRVIYQKSANM